MTPVMDAYVENRCDPGTGLCFFRTDPPFGMEIRKLHDLLEFLDIDLPDNEKEKYRAMFTQSMTPGGAAFDPAEDEDQLRTSGRLNETECWALGYFLPPGHRTVFLRRSREAWACE